MKLFNKDIKIEITKTRDFRFSLFYLIPIGLGVLLHAAYRWPWYLGWMVIFIWPFLFLQAREYFSRVDFVLILSTFLFLHFEWILTFLQKYSAASSIAHFLIYILIVFVYLVSFLIFLFFVRFISSYMPKCRIIFLWKALSIFFFFSFIEHWGASFLGARIGYPLLHPVLPILSFFSPIFKNKIVKRNPSFEVCILRPQSTTIESLHHALESVSKNRITDSARYYITPESAVEKDLSRSDHSIYHLLQLLGVGDVLCIGAIKQDEWGVGHATYVYSKDGLVACFEKELLVPFYEYVPDFFKKYKWGEQFFLSKRISFVAGKRAKNRLFFDCFICADFFLKSLNRSNKSTLFFVLVNDKRLPEFAIDLLMRYVQWKSFKEGAVGFYIGWNNSLKIL